MLLDDTTYKVVITILILLAGFTISKTAEKLITYIWREKYKTSIEKIELAHITGLIINTTTIIIALSFLKINIEENIFTEIYNHTPLLLSAILLGILIILSIKIIFYFIDKFISTSRLKSIAEEYNQEETLANILILLRYTLYLIFGLLALNSLGINIGSTIILLQTILFPVLILTLALLFVGLRPIVENIFSGLFLKRMNFLRVGEQIKVNKETYTIDTVKRQGIILKAKSDFNTFIPYKELYEKQLIYKEILYDLNTLEKIKDNFLAQHPSYCGPASASIILKIFGHQISQDEIGKAAKTIIPPQKMLNITPTPGGTHPKDLIKTIEKLTEGKVKGVWIRIDKINNLKLELKTWLNNKALIIIDYKKSFLFPEAEKAHYAVCFSIKGDELLILDPNPKKGGVYFADIKKVYLGMNTYSELLKEKRGYIVFAPSGTTAYHRIEKGLIYSDPNLYKNLNNNLTKELDKLIKKTSKIETILPKSIKKMIDEYKKKDKVTYVWSPKSR